jgi:hypothetical protein
MSMTMIQIVPIHFILLLPFSVRNYRYYIKIDFFTIYFNTIPSTRRRDVLYYLYKLQLTTQYFKFSLHTS